MHYPNDSYDASVLRDCFRAMTEVYCAQWERSKAVLIQAPTGYGKSLMAHQLTLHSAPFWLSLREKDNHWAAFVQCLAGTLGVSEVHLDLLLNGSTLFEMIPKDAVIVLENYQHISTPAIHHFVNQAIEHGHGKWVILSRVWPEPLLFNQWKWAQVSLILRCEQLRLPREMEQYVSLNALGEGWLFLLQVLESLPTLPENLEQFSGLLQDDVNHVVNQVFGELWQGIDSRMQQFLIWKSLSGAEEPALYKEMGCEYFSIQALAYAGVPVGYDEAVHPLFLRWCATRTLSPQIQHERLLGYFLKTRDTEKVVVHAVAAQSWSFACEGLLEIAPEWIGNEKQRDFVNQVEKIPIFVRHQHPELCCYYVLALAILQQQPEAQKSLHELHQHLSPLPHTALNSILRVLNVLVFHQRSVLENTEVSPFWEVIRTMAKAHYSWLVARENEILKYYNEAKHLSQGYGYLGFFWRMALQEGKILMQSDQVSSAYAVFHEALEYPGLKSIQDKSQFSALDVHQAEVQSKRCQWSEMQRSLTNAYRNVLSSRWGSVETEVSYYLKTCPLYLFSEQPHLANPGLDKLNQIPWQGSPMIPMAYYEHLKKVYGAYADTLQGIFTGNLDLIVDHYQKYSLTADPHLYSDWMLLFLGHLLLQQKAYDPWLLLCQSSKVLFKSWPAPLLVLEAFAHYEKGQRQKALDLLTPHWEQWVKEQYLSLFYAPGPLALSFEPLVRELSMLNEHVDSSHFIRCLPSITLPRGAETLNTQEKRILDFIYQELSNAQMAQRLILSVNTVKTHRRNLYRKLGFRNKADAIAYRRENRQNSF